MGTALLDIDLPRNADWVRAWTFLDDSGEAIDLTGAVFELDVKRSAGDPGPVLGSAEITIVDAVGGIIEVALRGPAFDALEGKQELVRLAYDCIATQDGDRLPIARGAINLLPKVS